MPKPSRKDKPVGFRPDLIRIGILAVLVIFVWITVYNRWTVQSWETPISYLETAPSFPLKPDVLLMLSWIKAGGEGHLLPFVFSYVPELGAPYTGNWNDYPVPEKALFCIAGLLGDVVGVFVAANLMVLFGHVLAAIGFYVACRMVNVSWVWAFAGGLIFGFSRFAFSHALNHLNVLYYWYVPFCLVVVEWMIRGKGLAFGDRRLTFAVVVAVVTGLGHLYFTGMFIQFIFFAGIVQACRNGWRAALPSVVIMGVSLATCVAMNLNTMLYAVVHGSNAGAVVRTYSGLEFFGLKLVDLVVPPIGHRFPPFSDWGLHHLNEVMLPLGEMPPSGYLGVVGLAALGYLVIVSMRAVADRKTPPLEAWLVLWIILFSETGGFYCVFGAMGIVPFRATARFSIFIQCIVLMWAARHLSILKFPNKLLLYGMAIFVTVLALYDQTPPTFTDEALAKTEQAVASDRAFTLEMEKRLPPGAMVFEIPLVPFPEAGAKGPSDYDHLRPYLYSKQLRYSFGSDKGRSQEAWQRELEGMSFDQVIPIIESYGFAALMFDRENFDDKGVRVLNALKTIGRTEMFSSDRDDLVCVILQPSLHPVMPGGG